MKKINLKNALSMLSRKEMKAINGGYGYTYDVCVFVCSTTPDNSGCKYVMAGLNGPGWYCTVPSGSW